MVGLVHLMVFVAFAVLCTITLALLIRASEWLVFRSRWYAKAETEMLLAITVLTQAAFMYLAFRFDLWLIWWLQK